jgi:hypothetical protein
VKNKTVFSKCFYIQHDKSGLTVFITCKISGKEGEKSVPVSAKIPFSACPWK